MMDTNRRTFLRNSFAAGALPLLFNGCARSFFANDRINVGVIGCGRIAHSMDIPLTIKHTELCRIVAVADLDRLRLADGKKFVEDWYLKEKGETAEVKAYSDYRMLLADPTIDAVMI